MLFTVQCFIMNIFFLIFGDFKVYMIGSLPMALTFGSINFVSTWIVPQKQKINAINKHEPHLMGRPESIDSSNTNKTNSQIGKKTLDSLLKSKKLIHEFMIHLSKEFCC